MMARLSHPQGRQAFPKSQRLLKKLEFKKVLDQGTKVVSPELVFFALEQGQAPRMGLIVSKKVGKAVQRNAVKRHLREVFRQSDLGEAWDLVVIARPAAAATGFHQMQAVWQQSLRRLRYKMVHRQASESKQNP